MNILRQWMLLATSHEQQLLAASSGTTRNYLYQVADGRRNPSAAMAARIETAGRDIARKSKGRLPKLKREALCEACGKCPYVRRCHNRSGDVAQ